MADPERIAPLSATSKELGYFLVQRGWLNPDHLRQAFDRQRIAGGSLDTCLLEAGAVTEGRLLEGLSEVYGTPAATAEDLRRAPANALDQVPVGLALRARAVPFRVVGGELWLAMEAIGDLEIQDEIAAITGQRLRPHVALEARIAEALERHFGHPCSERLATLLERLNQPPSLWAGSGPGASEIIPLTADERARLKRVSRRSAAVEEPIRPLSYEEVEERLNRAEHREEIGHLLLDYLVQPFRRALLFKVDPAGVRGWMGRGAGVDIKRLEQFSIRFDRPSVFLNLHRGSGFHLGPLPPMPAHLDLARLWGGTPPREAMVWPVLVRGRMVVALYGDRAKAPLTGIDVGDLRRLASTAAAAFELYLMRRKQRKS